MTEIIKQRLALLEKNLKEEKASSNPSKRYIEDLEASIAHCKTLLVGPEIITGAL